MAEARQELKYGKGADFSDPNTSHSRMVALVGREKAVLEFGCASGYMSRVLRDHGCRVTGIEVDQEAAGVAVQYCERVIVADLSGKLKMRVVQIAALEGDRMGLPGLVEGAPADLIVYDTDPRVDLQAVFSPRRTVLKGRVVRS